MGLLSIFKRAHKDGAPAESASRASTNTTPAPSVHQARTRARRRLIGASLLVLMGIVAFPILFESQPRPIPVDIPIEIPRAEGAPPLRIPPAVSSAPVSAPTPAPTPSVPAARSQVVVVEPAVPASAAAPTPKPPPAETAAAAKVAADKEKADKLEKEKAKEAAAKKSAAEAARAKALLEGKEAKAADTPPKTAAAAGRFVVQVGAYADADIVKDVRQKVEKLGLKTYTQVVDTSAGNRTRVRVGPLESKEQADKVLERLKAAGLSAVVLTL